MLNDGFSFRQANELDMLNVFNLSNDDLVRKNALTPSKITWKVHESWFKSKMHSSDCVFYILETDQQEFMGIVRFDYEKNNEYIITIHLAQDFRGRGFAVKALMVLSREFIAKEKGKIIYAYIKPENFASIKSFLKANYKLQRECIICDTKVVQLSYGL